jgi:hypothetical protein
MVEATQAYHSKVLTAIRVIAERYAREEVKRQIRASGARISQYPSREIARMAHSLLEERWKEFIAKAKTSAVVREVREECERRERRKAQRKTVHILSARTGGR